MIPGDRCIRCAIALRQIRHRRFAADEAVDPLIPQLGIPAHETGVLICAARARTPVERRLGIHIIADGEKIANVRDAAPIRRAVSEEFSDTEVRRQHAATSAAAHILEEKRNPEHRDFADVQYARPRHHHVLGHELHILRSEVKMWLGVIAVRERAIFRKHDMSTAHQRIGNDRAALGAQKEPLARRY